MPEMILPGTYIEVRAEKLIAAPPIGISNVGIVGTASRGKLNTAMTPSSLSEAREIFGPPDAFDNPTEPGAELTLMRALELAYASGAQKVFAVRVARTTGADAGTSASYAIATDGSPIVANAAAPGTGYNGMRVVVTAGSGAGLLNVAVTLDRSSETWRDAPAAAADFARCLNGAHATYDYRTKASTGGASRLLTLDASAATGNVTPGTATETAATKDGAKAIAADYEAGLNALLNEDVHIIVLAGQTAADMADKLKSHCENASTDLMKHERIGVFGADLADGDTDSPVSQEDGRLIFVTPGVQVSDSVSGKVSRLSGGYSAAAVAGRLASLDPEASPTNKTLNVPALTKTYNGTELEQLILGRVLALESRAGAIRIVKGITSATLGGAFSQITTRRIVDYARYGVRAACNQYIGRLNNERVREAMKGTINGFLADMVDQEMLISYELDVSATREQQIRGIAVVTMVLRPTFSIDYIRVIMNLE